ncbi:16S rRNA (uracil(1498)-N(3))-methyltransferase [bacterium]|nr:16S rRNA (uracil(1498)-N(3))-methyltransferase [bacterium]
MRDSQYFYVHPLDVFPDRNILILKNEEAHHCIKVLRKKTGDEFYVIDGLGHEYEVQLAAVSKNTVECRIQHTRNCPRELPYAITLAQAMITKDHFEWVIEKATELGVSEIIPIRTRRSLVEPGLNKIQRWQKILLSATKQSRRSVIPAMKDVQSFEQLLFASYDIKIIFHEKSDRPVLNYLSVLENRCVQSMLICIGPEGGFTDEEIDTARSAGIEVLSLGSRRLRAETAAVAAISIFSNMECPSSL